MSDYFDGRSFLYEMPFGKKGQLFYDGFYAACLKLLGVSVRDWESLTASINEVFSVEYSGFENLSDPHLNEGIEGSLRSYSEPPTRRTRVFLLLNELLREALSEEADLALRTRGRRNRPKHLLPSPLFFLRRYLTAPSFPASEAYAHAILRSIIFAAAIKYYHRLKLSENTRQALERATDLPESDSPIDVIRHFTSFENVDDALRKIWRHRNIRDVTYPSNPSDFIVMHMLASRGYLLLSFPIQPSSEFEDQPPSTTKARRRLERQETRDEFLTRGSLLNPDAVYEFRLSRKIETLPPASEIINEIDGLPIAIPNADIIFARGLRFTSSEGTVIRLSGPSGGGKTSVALGFATALQPLGVDTIYLSCEENGDDLERRIQTLVPYFIRRTETYRKNKTIREWFQPKHLRGGAEADVQSINQLINDLVKARGNTRSVDIKKRPPGATPLLIVLDGIHELLLTDRGDHPRAGESKRLRDLVENLRRTGALTIIMSADHSDPAVADLDYVVDFVADIAIEKTDDVSQPLVRKFILRKTRRQFARMGAHLLNLSPRVGIALTPQIAAQRDVHRDFAWVTRRTDAWFDVFRGIKTSSTDGDSYSPKLFEFSQVLVTGKGSSGKAAFALRLVAGGVCHAAARSKGVGLEEDLFGNRTAHGHAGRARGIVSELQSPPSHRRILVVSFLYQKPHYDVILRNMRRLPKSDFAFPPPVIELDVETFYPGHLRPEDFLRKVMRRLEVSFLDGMPYDAVVIDGLHNVFLQFPRLQEASVLWPVMYEMLRKYKITVVTTHTHMDMPGSAGGGHMALDLDVARERAAPILQALISAADFYFDISSEGENRDQFFIETVNASDQPFPPKLIWDRKTYAINTMPRVRDEKR